MKYINKVLDNIRYSGKTLCLCGEGIRRIFFYIGGYNHIFLYALYQYITGSNIHPESSTAHIMKADVKAFSIKNVENIDWESFDTIIIGNIPSDNAHVR